MRIQQEIPAACIDTETFKRNGNVESQSPLEEATSQPPRWFDQAMGPSKQGSGAGLRLSHVEFNNLRPAAVKIDDADAKKTESR